MAPSPNLHTCRLPTCAQPANHHSLFSIHRTQPPTIAPSSGQHEATPSQVNMEPEPPIQFDASSSENMGESGLPPVSLPNESTSIRSPSALFSAGLMFGAVLLML
ncbi:uncharacterized protein LOC110271011 isoform X2 [Arachis ipaensis]|uniref:uncharacterized protein LOC110271011 isoform X2 n=1 Tax=Arachis ipaensis TaxID=130454 RepID=UPI000A2B7655|nr:uncharacterized protein LOC110271011 isoform X2 [Arachis ipaensis]